MYMQGGHEISLKLSFLEVDVNVSEQFYPKFLNMTKYRVVIFKKIAYHPCRNADLNGILFAATRNGFICQIGNSLL